MKINPDIFKSYDIRGIYPSDINEEVAYEIGKNFAGLVKGERIVIGRDGRNSSLLLKEAFGRGILSTGADLVDIGLVASECVYFAVNNLKADAGVMITASHNPKEYNGFKMVDKNADMIRGKDLLGFENNIGSSKREGKVEQNDIWKEYLDLVFSLIKKEEIKELKIAVDSGNGMASEMISRALGRLPQIKASLLNWEVDGNFPGRPSNPLEKGASDGISNLILKEKLDFGFMFDGDADRIFLVDEKGNMLPSEIILILLAKYFLEKYPGTGVAYNLACSRAVPEAIKKFGGIPVRTAVGYVNVREQMKKNNGVMGGEFSGHFCFKDNNYADSGLISFLTLVKIIPNIGKPLSEIAKDLFPYFKADMNIETEDKEKAMQKAQKEYADFEQDFLDGITVKGPDWWFNIRSSQTEPLLRITMEAETEEKLNNLRQNLAELVK